MINYFELYDISETLQPDLTLVRKRWQELSRIYHPDKFATATDGELAEAMQRTALNNQAYKTFTNPDSTLAYVLKLYGVLADEEKYALPADFLMEMMELNEEIDSAQAAPAAQQDGHSVINDKLSDQFKSWEKGMLLWIEKFNGGDRDQKLLGALKDYYFRKKYLLRLKERMP